MLFYMILEAFLRSSGADEENSSKLGNPAHSFNITLAFKTRTIQLLLQNITLGLKTRTLQLVLQRELLSKTNYRKLSGSSGGDELLQTGWLNKTIVIFFANSLYHLWSY